jgi:hypothetical protein
MQDAKEVLIVIGCGLAGIALIGAAILAPLRRRARLLLRALSNDELATRVFRYEPQYFAYIGQGQPAVVEFQELVRDRDVQRIAARWPSLQRSFRRLERRVGHRGRPLIFEYYNWYELEYRELIRRIKDDKSGANT